MTLTQRQKRRGHLIRNIPDVFNYHSVLYIGAKVMKRWPKGMTFMDGFRDAAYEIDVLEPWWRNVVGLHQFNDHGREFKDDVFIPPGTFRRIISGDVRKVGRLVYKNYDVVMFWHGPEHLASEEILITLRKLENIATKIVVVGCPYGEYKQGEVGGNRFEKHLISLYPEFFEDIGWEHAELGERDVRTSNLLAWKRTDNG